MYGRKPYHVHLLDVIQVLRRFVEWDNLTQEMVDAAWLHDVVEDTDATVEEVKEKFGSRVAELVHAVTNEEGSNRKERHLKTYPKIRDTTGAIILKLADRIANMEQTVSHDRLGRRPGKLFNMYLKEWDGFQEALRGRCRGESATAVMMWEHLDKLFAEGEEKQRKAS